MKETKRKNLEELIARANASQAEYDARMLSSGGTADDFGNRNVEDVDGIRVKKESHGQQSRRAYLQILRKVIDSSDILLQVLDARDPIGTRIHPSIEDTILRHCDKKMVLVLNKIDLIPKEVVTDWLNYFRKSRPTVAIKSGTNIGGGKVGRSEVDCQSALQSSCGVGVDGLLGLLKNYARSSGGGGKTCITVGIIGYPNVGKSSILNTLKRSRAVGVSPKPGFTTSMQEVVLDKNLRLVDSPGVVFDDSDEVNGAETLLRNCVNPDSVEDPIPGVQALLNKCSAESLMMTYAIPAFARGDVMMFLAMIAKKNGKVLKGGIPDKESAARLVLRDWNSGKIPYFTRPPTASSENDYISESGRENDAQIVSSFGEEFDVSKFDADVLNSLQETDAMDFVEMISENKQSAGNVVNFLTESIHDEDDESGDDDDDSDDDEDMEDDESMDEDEDTQVNQRFNSRTVANAEDYDFSAM
jgi:nuclear GTP-binding protein